MPNSYFSFFPELTYDGIPIKNVTLRPDVLDSIKSDPYLFYTYQIEEGETAEYIAQFYYGNPELSWLIYLSNDIIDPYSQWPLTERQLKATIRNKYHDIALQSYKENNEKDNTQNILSELEVIRWTSREMDSNSNPVTGNIQYYVETSDGEYHISPDTYQYGDIVQGDFRAVRFFEYESKLNDEKRNIRLLDDRYLDVAINNMRRILNE